MVYSDYKKTVLANGLTIVSEKIPSVRSVTFGVWIKSGSRDEFREINGAAHFLEHMMFKGTKKRKMREIAQSIESVGGFMNAFTTKEQTCYYAEILDDQLPKAVDVLSDMMCHSVFPAKEMEKEREVILDEIESVEDTPDDLVQEIFVEKLYPQNTLGYPILGSKESITLLTRDQLLDFYRQFYTAGNMVIAAAGNVDHAHLVDLCEQYFQLPAGTVRQSVSLPQTSGNGEHVINRAVTQAHICLGSPGLSYSHHQKYDLLLLNTLLGGGMGSRLFQNIRERHGVAYSIYSFLDFFRDNGLMAIYLGTEKNKTDKALKLLKNEIDRLKTKPVSQREIKQIKTQLKGNLVLSMESTARRMNRLAKMEIYLQEFQDIDKVIDGIDNVTRDRLFELANWLFNEDRMLQVMFLPQKN